MRGLVAAATLLLTAAPAAARDLAVPVDKGWRHAATGVTLRATLIDLPRRSLADTTEGEWDVSAGFGDAKLETSLTVYVFHPAAGSAALWFDRARTQIENRDTYGGVTAPAAPVAFAAPGATTPSALRQTFAARRGPYRSTGLALVPVGDWLVAVRLSSVALDAAALDAQLLAAVAAIGWPKEAKPAPAAAPIAACADTLPYRKARQRKPDVMQALLSGAILSAAAAKAPEAAPATPGPLCRDGAATVAWGVYRTAGERSGYTLALGDSGRVASVYRSFDAPGLPSGYAVALRDVDGSSASLPYFDALPRPEQVLAAIEKGEFIARNDRSGNRIAIDGGLVR